MSDKRKLQIVFKETFLSEMFNYFIKLLEEFPGHQFYVSQQNTQMKNLIKIMLISPISLVTFLKFTFI